MNIQILSDLHLEFGDPGFDFGGVDLVILAGDVHVGEKGIDWIFKTITKTPVLYVLGNHEYYGGSYPKTITQIKAKAEGTHVHVLDRESIALDGIRFHCTTLWTNFELLGDPKIAGYHCQQNMSDYKKIRLDPSYSKLRSIDTHVMFYRSINWLKESLQSSPEKKNIVVTHHAPSSKSIPDKYKGQLISAAYASNLDTFISDTKPDIWIHGHVHEPFDYFIGTTRVICNPSGYLNEPYNGHSKKLVLEVSA